MTDRTVTTDRIEKCIDLKAPIERVWHALTDHKEFGTWFQVDLDGPFVPGQVSTGRITFPGCGQLQWAAKVEKMEAPRYFAYTWHPYAVDPAADYTQEPPTLVEFRLEPIPTGTRLTVVESGFDALPPHRRELALRKNDGGWAIQVENIRTHVER